MERRAWIFLFHKPLTFLTALFLFTGFVLAGSLSYAAPPEGKGNAGGNGNGVGQGGTPPGQEKKADTSSSPSDRGNSDRAISSSETKANSSSRSEELRLERQHPHQDRGALTSADQGNSSTHRQDAKVKTAHAVGLDHGIRGREAARAHVDSLLKNLNKFEHAKWDYNPKDARGQGNMGKVDMRSPYGFDKDSGREGAERGRAIHIREPVLDLASLVTIGFQITDYIVAYYQQLLDIWSYWYSRTGSSYWASQVNWVQQQIAYLQSLPYTQVAVNTNNQTLDYTLNLGDVPTDFEADKLLVTMTLTSLSDYTSSFWEYDPTLQRMVLYTVDYDVGEVVVQQTQEVTLTDSGTFTFSYDPPGELAGWSGTALFDMSVTVTEPVSGATYRVSYDEAVRLFRCPYGIAYDKATGKPIAGAEVSIHNVDGSIVPLDKAANPNVSNPQKTDATGRYNAKLAVGKKYYLTVQAPGYQEYKSPLFSERWHIVREDVGLTPVEGNAQPSSTTLPAASSSKPEGQGEGVHPALGLGSPLMSK